VARQKLGQHFLFQESILERIAAAACRTQEPLVVEIGPGRGALTRKLLERAARVVAIEVDGALVEELRSRFAGEPRLEIVHADVLGEDLGRWGPAAIAGNLPYYISSPIFARVVERRAAVRRAVFLVQKEVAERVAAAPGSRDYGYLTVALRLFFDPTILFAVRPGAFRPPPKVESAVLALEPNDRAAELGIADPGAFLLFVSACFRQKRKTLRNNLWGAYPRERLEGLSQMQARAEQLSIGEIASIYRHIVG
jgi:16S rRNA (adenine1518-N6/adenine1519-N6)-dimethyltransferase